jgi:hypothetical protein
MVEQPAKSRILQMRPELPFAGDVPHQAPPRFALHDGPLATGAAYGGTVVIEVHFPLQPVVLPPRFRRRMYRQHRLRFERHFLQLQLGRQLQSGQRRHVQQAVHQIVFFAGGNFHRLAATQQPNPRKRIEIVERGDGRVGDEQSTRHQKHGLADGQPIRPAHQAAFQPPGAVGGVQLDRQEQLPRLALVPFQYVGDALFVPCETQSPGGGDGGEQHQAEIKWHTVAMHGGPRFTRLTRPVAAVGCAADEVRQNAAVFLIVDFVEFAGPQLKRFELAPLAVGAPLTLRGLHDQDAGLFAGRGVDLVEHLPFATCGRGDGLVVLHRLAEFAQPAFPLSLRRGGRGFHRLGHGRHAAGALGGGGPHERFVVQLVLFPIGERVENQRVRLHGERRNVARLDRSGEVVAVVGGKNGGPDVLALHVAAGLLHRLAAIAGELERAVLPADLGVILDPIANHAEQVIFRHPQHGDPLGLQIRRPAEADVAAKLALQQLRQRHGRFPVPHPRPTQKYIKTTKRTHVVRRSTSA